MKQETLFTKQFIAFNAASFLANINMAVFFQLHQYLLTLPIDPKLSGFLIGIFSLAGVFMQPLLSPFVGPRNGRRLLVVGVVGTIVALLLYRWAASFPALLAVRIFHGVAFITFVTATNALMVSFIPPSKSGQAFGVISVNILLPQAIIPALLGWMNLGPAYFVDILSATAFLMVPAALMPLFVLKNVASRGPDAHQTEVRILDVIREDLRDARVLALLFTNFLSFLAYVPVFFYLKEYAEGRGIANPGSFFSVATGTMIAIRLLGGVLFDRLNKARMIVFAFGLLTIGYALLIFAAPGVFLLLALILGVAWSLFMPFLNALLFDCSRPAARALNLNLSMALLQSAYFVGPIVSGLILQYHGYEAVFLYCSGIAFAAFCLNLAMQRSYGREHGESGVVVIP
jgi:predicted MFS family arabinose efflux permease